MKQLLVMGRDGVAVVESMNSVITEMEQMEIVNTGKWNKEVSLDFDYYSLVDESYVDYNTTDSDPVPLDKTVFQM